MAVDLRGFGEQVELEIYPANQRVFACVAHTSY
jgi:hypothetical protein